MGNAPQETGELIAQEEWAEMAMARSGVYGFLGAIYCQLPDEQFVSGLFSDGFAAFLTGVEETAELPQAMRDGAKLVGQFVEASGSLPADELKTKVGVERTRLFRGVKPGYGPLPPYESVYSSAGQDVDAHPIAAVAGEYALAGAKVSKDASEQPDYIGLELDFMRHLCAREADAWRAGNRELALECLEKQQAFLTNHIATWVPRYCDAMNEDAKLGLYQGLAQMTQGFVLDESEKAPERLKLARVA